MAHVMNTHAGHTFRIVYPSSVDFWPYGFDHLELSVRFPVSREKQFD